MRRKFSPILASLTLIGSMITEPPITRIGGMTDYVLALTMEESSCFVLPLLTVKRLWVVLILPNLVSE
jgi:hypothetical protein